ncbi:MAG TPA: hypothetical protein VJ841_02815 [Candidatus Saccharimonadales bacterium]|nr:hypothetical protein [Candidatus Saccharimonadales bacterium]
MRGPLLRDDGRGTEARSVRVERVDARTQVPAENEHVMEEDLLDLALFVLREVCDLPRQVGESSAGGLHVGRQPLKDVALGDCGPQPLTVQVLADRRAALLRVELAEHVAQRSVHLDDALELRVGEGGAISRLLNLFGQMLLELDDTQMCHACGRGDKRDNDQQLDGDRDGNHGLRRVQPAAEQHGERQVDRDDARTGHFGLHLARASRLVGVSNDQLTIAR